MFAIVCHCSKVPGMFSLKFSCGSGRQMTTEDRFEVPRPWDSWVICAVLSSDSRCEVGGEEVDLVFPLYCLSPLPL